MFQIKIPCTSALTLGMFKNQEKLLKLENLLHLSPKSKMTIILLEDSPISATGGEYK
jgi:hypothetical protein